MKKFTQWLTETKKDEQFALDANGGIIPSNFKKAKKIDLITLPEDVKGTNCGNCKWVKLEGKDAGFCHHSQVQMWVNSRNCCAFWDNDGVKRPWEKPT